MIWRVLLALGIFGAALAWAETAKAIPYYNNGLMIGNDALLARAHNRQYLPQAKALAKAERKNESARDSRIYPVTEPASIWSQAIAAQYMMTRRNAAHLLDPMNARTDEATSGQGRDVYYDDFVWVGLAYMRGWHLTHAARFLAKAKAIMRFEKSGWYAPTGGVLWHRMEPSEARWKCFVATVSTAGAEQLALVLYLGTHHRRYLRWALKAHRWMESKMRRGVGFRDALQLSDSRCPHGPSAQHGGTPSQQEMRYNVFSVIYYRELNLLKGVQHA